MHKLAKIFLCLMVLIGGWLSVKPKEQAHAIAPLVAWGLWTAGGVVADIAIEQGIKWVSKTAGKKATEKVTKKVLDNADDFDFTKEAPKKTKTGELYVPVSTLDKQKIAKLWKDEGMEVIEAQTARKVQKPTYDIDVPDTDPLAYTSIVLNFAGNSEGIDFIKSLYDITFTPMPYEKKTKVVYTSAVDGSNIASYNGHWEFKGGTRSAPIVYDVDVTKNAAGGNRAWLIETDTQTYRDVNGQLWNGANVVDPTSPTYKFWEEYKKQLALANRTIYVASGMVVPNNVQYIYDVPLNTPSGYDIGNTKKPSPGYTVKLPDKYNDGQEYELTENNYQEFEIAYNDYITNEVENDYDLSTTNYDYSQTVINNYYTYEEDEDEKSLDDVKNDITIIIENNNQDNDGGSGNLPSGEETNKFYQLMANTGQKITDMYNGVVKFFEVATTGFSSLTTGMGGFMKFLDEFFDWLPDEYRALLGAGFTLGVVSFFLRR